MKRLVLILFLVSVCYGTPFYLLEVRGDTFTSHLKPITDSTLDVGTATLYWRYIYGDSFTDGTALWESSNLSGFNSIYGTIITGGTLTDGTFVVTGGTITGALWQGTAIDISDYTNLVAGTNITLIDDTLNVDDAFLINDGDDTTTGTITSGGFTTAGTTDTGVIIVDTHTPASSGAAGTAGTIAWDANYIYIAIANNSWKRAAIAAWGFAGENMIYEDSNNMIYEDGNNMVYD